MKKIITLLFLFFISIEMIRANQSCANKINDYRKACDKQDKNNCIELGKCLQKSNPNESLKAFEKACELSGEDFACTMFAKLFMPINKKAAEEILSQRCKKGFLFACPHEKPSYMQEVDKLLKANKINQAINILSSKCENNIKPACKRLLILAKNKNIKIDEEILLVKLCSQRSYEDCHLLGKLQLKNRNVEAAIKGFRLACENNVALACGDLGTALYRSNDIIESLKYFKMACDFKIADYCQFLNSFKIDLMQRCILKTDRFKCENFFK